MPSLEILPFIQCHQTRGRALWGGWRKPWRRESFAVGAGDCAIAADASSKIKQARFMREIVHRNVRGTARAPLSCSECLLLQADLDQIGLGLPRCKSPGCHSRLDRK